MNMRLKKVLDDIQKTEDKILELQEYVKKLKIQKKQMEDAEIIKAIRSMKMDSREMLTFRLRAMGALSQVKVLNIPR